MSRSLRIAIAQSSAAQDSVPVVTPVVSAVAGYQLATRAKDLLEWPLDTFQARFVDIARRFVDECAEVLHEYVAAVMECDKDIYYVVGATPIEWVTPKMAASGEAANYYDMTLPIMTSTVSLPTARASLVHALTPPQPSFPSSFSPQFANFTSRIRPIRMNLKNVWNRTTL